MIDFHIEWKDAPGVRDPVLSRTWCALTIRIQGEPVTRVFDRRTKGWRNSVHGSVFPLCNWIVDNLWFLLYEPYRWAVPYGSRDLARNDVDRPWVHRHSLLAAREGGALPDLTFFRDGDAVLLRWLKDGGDASHPFLRFVQEGQAHLPSGNRPRQHREVCRHRTATGLGSTPCRSRATTRRLGRSPSVDP